MFPKQPSRKRKCRKHAESILQKGKYCYLCALMDGNYSERPGLHRHHIYGGANRGISEENGFWVRLCIAHHEYGPYAVHLNHRTMRMLQRICQQEYEKNHSREAFMELIGRNYLDE